MDWLNFEDFVDNLLSQYAYQPLMVYSITIVMMVLSAFGLPVPEEFTILTVAFLSYMGANPQDYPPPYPAAPVIDKWVASAICVFAVLFSDIVVYSIGHRSGRLLEKSPRFKKIFEHGKIQKVQKWTHDYGVWAVFAFRFAPGVRFPGHLFCGMMSLRLWKFLMMDAFAALISIPTQMLLVATYGDDMIAYFKKFKIYLFSIIGIFFFFLFLKKLWVWFTARSLKLRREPD